MILPALTFSHGSALFDKEDTFTLNDIDKGDITQNNTTTRTNGCILGHYRKALL